MIIEVSRQGLCNEISLNAVAREAGLALTERMTGRRGGGCRKNQGATPCIASRTGD
jgi:hypothetical protein